MSGPPPQPVADPQEDEELLSTDGAMDSVLLACSKQHSPSSDLNGYFSELNNGRTQPSYYRTQQFASSLSATSNSSRACCSPQPGSSYVPYQRPLGLPAGYIQPTPYPSRTESSSLGTVGRCGDSWCHLVPPDSCGSPEDYSSEALRSSMVPRGSSDYPSSDKSLGVSLGSSHCGSLPPPGRSSLHQAGSLEQPRSLHSLPMPAAVAPHSHYHHHHPHLQPHPVPRTACCPRCPIKVLRIDPVPHPDHGNQRAHGPSCPNGLWPLHRTCFNRDQTPAIPASNSDPTQLSIEQRKVFVTYEKDSDEHQKEVINFVALLRHNGFFTHIDMFEQQYRSINKIDFMERYISEKDYLIIFVISPKYHQTVTNTPAYPEDDETLNTVYIHKQLQNEFIQNGCKNFRFIPILFPGARKCHVPTWLQNTHVYSWPRDCDDILRRLMRVEKYNPPPIGPLPTIVSVPI
ncbi:E3 ubiquitin ligase TRAF3IP2 isoform X2 [Engraulis encrasicolus]|uniref:E3 ubiquitin ligase TRAF3IP2 isoform X2 n=1 Tax=Engraulis encrasicolus TaxID=184585 RepID=UPI002FD0F402